MHTDASPEMPSSSPQERHSSDERTEPLGVGASKARPEAPSADQSRTGRNPHQGKQKNGSRKEGFRGMGDDVDMAREAREAWESKPPVRALDIGQGQHGQQQKTHEQRQQGLHEGQQGSLEREQSTPKEQEQGGVEEGPLAGIPVPRISYGIWPEASTSQSSNASNVLLRQRREPVKSMDKKQTGWLRAPMHEMRAAITMGSVESLPAGVVVKAWLRNRKLVRERRLDEAIAHIQEVCAAGCDFTDFGKLLLAVSHADHPCRVALLRCWSLGSQKDKPSDRQGVWYHKVS
jgi:hypothetical protein